MEKKRKIGLEENEEEEEKGIRRNEGSLTRKGWRWRELPIRRRWGHRSRNEEDG